MGASTQVLSCLSSEIQILQAKNVEFRSHGNLFVRCYIPAGNNKKIQLNSREISSNSKPIFWNESFCLECSGTEDSIHKLEQESLVFELRWRKSRNPIFLGKRIGGGSQLIGRAEVPWKTVVGCPGMEMEKWIMLIPKTEDDVKPPWVQIGMRIRVQSVAEIEKKRRLKKWDEECGCGSCTYSGCQCDDNYDIFGPVAALEAL